MGKKAATTLLFVLAGFVAADEVFASMATHMGTRGLQSTTLDVCGTEWQACAADPACLECNSSCEPEFLDDTTCDDLDQVLCCALEVNEECFNIEALNAYAGRWWLALMRFCLSSRPCMEYENTLDTWL